VKRNMGRGVPSKSPAEHRNDKRSNRQRYEEIKIEPQRCPPTSRTIRADG
jgi:hypothetical protein